MVTLRDSDHLTRMVASVPLAGAVAPRSLMK